MSESTAHIRQQLHSAGELRAVVRTMKAAAAASVGQYEKSVSSLVEYYHTVELALHVCLRELAPTTIAAEGWAGRKVATVSAIVFGSDQGLVGQFNEAIAGFATKSLAAFPSPPRVWVVGERLQARLLDAGIAPAGLFRLPSSVGEITPLIDEILTKEFGELHLFYNRPVAESVYTPVTQRLLPLDESWEQNLVNLSWPTKHLPEVLGSQVETLRALIREFLFVSLFRACAESLASENASRLAAMQRADKNIDELLETLNSSFHRLRQSSIDEELFDIVSGFEALSPRDRI